MKLNIKNFQSIAEADIEIGPLTVLVGQSDVGKSAVIRALRLLHRNNGGLELVKYGATSLYIQQTCEDGSTASISKGKGQNAYQAGARVFSKVGKDVPPEICGILRTDELVLDKDLAIDLNFSGQFDSPFLLADSSAVVTKAISSLSGINILYSAIREANAEAQKAKAKGDVLTDSLKGLLKYDTLSLEAEEVKRIFDSLVLMQSLKEKTEAGIVSKKTKLTTLTDIGLRQITVSVLEAPLKDAQELQKQLGEAYRHRDTLKVCKDKFFGISEFTLTAEYADGVKYIGESLEKLAYVKSIIADKREKVEKLKDTFSSLADKVLKNGEQLLELTRLESEYATLKEQVKICEACGRPL